MPHPNQMIQDCHVVHPVSYWPESRWLDEASVEQVFRRRTAILHEKSSAEGQRRIAVGGKALRLSFDNSHDRNVVQYRQRLHHCQRLHRTLSWCWPTPDGPSSAAPTRACLKNLPERRYHLTVGGLNTLRSLHIV
jgi:hypothetical protein